MVPGGRGREKLGFLFPGDLSVKIDPYLRPLYDALYGCSASNTWPADRAQRHRGRAVHMRGRTLNKASIILDESQNTGSRADEDVLTRIGLAIAVITGDVTQVDSSPRHLPAQARD